MREAREDLDNYFKLKSQKTGDQQQQLNLTMGPNDTKGKEIRMVGLLTASAEEGDHIGHDVDEMSKVGNIKA